MLQDCCWGVPYPNSTFFNGTNSDPQPTSPSHGRPRVRIRSIEKSGVRSFTLLHKISYRVVSCRVASHRTVPYRTISYHIISYHIISYHVISYHIIYNKANLRDLIAATGLVISNWIQIVDFSARVTVNLMDDIDKQ